jgi:hypothetical protein
MNNVSAISWREQVTVDDMLNNVHVVQQECVVILVPHLCVDSPAEVCMVSDSCLTRKAK